MFLRKKLLLFICFILFMSIATTQPLQLDTTEIIRLEQRLSYMPDNSQKVDTLIRLSRAFRADLDSAKCMNYAKQAVKLAREIDYNPGLVEAMGHLAFIYAFASEWPTSFGIINEVLPIAEKSHPRHVPFLYNIQFINYDTKGQVGTAKSWALKALHHPVFPSIDDNKKWPTYYQLAKAYNSLGQQDSAEYYAGFLKDFLGKVDEHGFRENTYMLLGDFSRQKEEYVQAIEYYKIIPQNALGLAHTFDKLKGVDSAIKYAKLALQIHEKRTVPTGSLESLLILARLYEKRSPDSSIRYWQLYADKKDLVFNSNKSKAEEELKLSEQQLQFDQDKREVYLRNRNIQTLLIAMAVVFLVSTLLFLRSNKIKQQANSKLEKAYAELKTTQAQLIQSEKMASLGELTAGIAHEIQNPLNFVNNFSEVNKELTVELEEEIMKGNYTDAKAIAKDIRDNEEKINLHGKRADAIVKGMLQHSRSRSGQKELTDINALAEEYLRLAYHGLKARDKSFTANYDFKPDPALQKVNVIPQDIGRVLLNLVNNAFQAVNGYGEKPIVTVTTSKSDNVVEIKVADNGPGIPDAIRDKIFQPFFTTKPTGQGTGLGLSLSYDIIKAHGGEIKVDNSPGEGAEFIISLPG